MLSANELIRFKTIVIINEIAEYFRSVNYSLENLCCVGVDLCYLYVILTLCVG